MFLKILLDCKVVWLNLNILFNWVWCVYFLIVVGLLKVILFNLLLKNVILIFICLILYLDFVCWKGIFVWIILFLLSKIIGKVLKNVGIWWIYKLLFFLFWKRVWFN